VYFSNIAYAFLPDLYHDKIINITSKFSDIELKRLLMQPYITMYSSETYYKYLDTGVMNNSLFLQHGRFRQASINPTALYID